MEKMEELNNKVRLSTWERINYLLDTRSFSELEPFTETQCRDFGMERKKVPGDAVITGFGTLGGRDVCIYAQDSTKLGGSTGEAHIQKICRIIDMAVRMRVPLIGLNDSSGGRIQEGITPHTGATFYSHTQASGIIPQITGIFGPCAGNSVYGASLTDFIIMVNKSSYMFITGPATIKSVIGEETTAEDLGGSRIHAQKTGVIDLRAEDDKACLDIIRRLHSYLPQSCCDSSQSFPSNDDPERTCEELEDIVPKDTKTPFDMKEVIKSIADRESFFEIKSEFAKNIIIGFIRLNGRVIGVSANQPLVFAGAFTVDSSDKQARFIRFCDAFNIPLLFLVDVPGYLPGVQQEHAGIIRHGAKVLYAICESTVPKVSLVIRKGYGGGLVAMAGVRSQGTDMVFSWAGAEWAIMGAESAVNFLYKKEIAEAKHPIEKTKEVQCLYREKFCNPRYVAARGVVDDIIMPKETRRRLIRAFSFLSTKSLRRESRKHGVMPL